MMKKKKKNKLAVVAAAILLVAVAVAAAVFVMNKLVANVSGRYMYRSEKVIDLRSAGIEDITGLMTLSDPEMIDLRGNTISAEQYSALKERFPGCDIIWDVPLSSGPHSSLSESLTLRSFDHSDIELMKYFPVLSSVDLSGSGVSSDDFRALESALPECILICDVNINNRMYPLFSDHISLNGGDFSASEINAVLQELTLLKEVTVSDCRLTADEQKELTDRYPDIEFGWDIDLCGSRFSNDVTELRLKGFSGNKMDELIKCAPLLKKVELIDLGGSVQDLNDICRIRDAFDMARVECDFRFLDRQISTDERELELSNIKNIDVTDFDLVTKAMPDLEKVVMCDCGIPDETMDELNHKYEGVRFVWTVYVTKYYPLRTDRTYFCGSDRPNAGYVAVSLNDEEIQPLKYCTDIVAMDLGHMHFTRLDFVKDMKQLKYLVISCGMIHDISAVSELESLYWLEMFNNDIKDISPILECKNLRYLNIGSCTGFDRSPVFEMDFLDYLWYPYNYFSDEEIERLQAALPNTVCYLDNENANAVSRGWREMDAYNELRDLMHMFR